ncbi:hypothetical protein V1504DRAFT_93296 [Lipomyces starkeyi]
MFSTFRVKTQSLTSSSAEKCTKSVSLHECNPLHGSWILKCSESNGTGDSVPPVSSIMSRVDTAELAATPSLSHTSTSVASSASYQFGSPTPETALQAIKYKEPRKRSYFDENLKIKLVRLCVLHQGEYVRRRKNQFWKDILKRTQVNPNRKLQATNLTRTGVPIRTPGQTMETLIRKRREQLKYRSRVAEADTELKRALDAFMQNATMMSTRNNRNDWLKRSRKLRQIQRQFCAK